MELSRRTFLAGSIAATAVGTHRVAARVHNAPSLTVHSTRVISQQSDHYHGWPTVARTRSGQLLLSYSGGREAHVCPFGRVELMRSNDEGKTWTWPQVVIDCPIDDRDSGVLETRSGAILITTFTSLAYEPILQRVLKGERKGWTDQRIDRWKSAHDRLSEEQRKQQLGTWIIRSTDSGANWSAMQRCPVNSPHGPIELSSGKLMYAGKRLWSKVSQIGVSFSDDDGQSWSNVTVIPSRPGDDPDQYHELHAVETAEGNLIAHIRNHNSKNAGETLQSESTDGGKTWTVPHSIGVWGLPSHLLRLRGGQLVMSYGYRRKPFGNQIRISEKGETWSAPLAISNDGVTGDLGYPSTVELSDGSLLSVWYEVLPGTTKAALRQAHWSLEV